MKELKNLVSVGTATLKDFESLGIHSVEELARCEPLTLYETLCALKGQQDPCVEDVMRCAVEQARHPALSEEQKKWPFWSRVRKERQVSYKLYVEKPAGFKVQFQAVGCYLEWNQRVFIIQRHPNSPQGLTWGLPAGKVDPQEKPDVAMRRELFEELELVVELSQLKDVGTLWIKLPHVDYTFQMFRLKLDAEPVFAINPEEIVDSAWVTLQEAQFKPLIAGGHEAFNYYASKVC